MVKDEVLNDKQVAWGLPKIRVEDAGNRLVCLF